MDDKPLLSVCVITYNQEKYIEQTLNSILEQNHSYTYEIVIGEDCSSDKTAEIILQYQRKYPEIIKPLFNNPNKGLLKNFYNVISNCNGKYIMECAGDDYWLPEKVNTQIKFMEENPDIGMCYGLAKGYNDKKKRFEKKSIGSKKESFEQLMLGNSIPALTTCYRKELAVKYIDEVKPLEQNWLMEDLPMWLWFTKNSKIKFLDKELGVYRILEETASHTNDVSKQKKFEDSCFAVREYFTNLYNEKELLDRYTQINEFYDGWKRKDRDCIIKNSKEVLKYDYSFAVRIKILIAKNKFLFNILYRRSI